MSIEVGDPWFLQNLATDVVLEGVVMNGSVRGPERVTEQIRTVVGLYRDYTLLWSADLDDRRVQEYTAVVDGRPVTGVGTFHLNPEGQVDHIVVNHRPLSAALTVSRLLGESPLGQHRDPNEFYRPTGQSYEDLVAYAATHGSANV
ncbi:hypothetical protein [Kribbella ginsengisoli]|uniref:SnoaL-like domain-containing protein n=1 Tax=Kribbella ginsengisoli TaxID=363865 RepID=A0ABP6XIM8_9ACTN